MKKTDKEEKQHEYSSFLYMLPGKETVEELTKAMDCINPDAIEIWTELNLLELTLDNGTLTFEDMMPQMMEKEDEALLKELKVNQVYACDYEAGDRLIVQKIVSCLTDKFGGFLASDSEDFRPFLKIEEL